MPLVSVVIPSYNHGRYIRKSVSSVLNQQFPDLQVIVVDDGSEDDTAFQVSQIHDSRLTYHRQTNRGLPATRNVGIAYTDSKYIAFLDADDFWLPRKLSQQVELLEASERIGLVYGGYHVVDDKEQTLATRKPRAVPKEHFHELILDNYIAGSATTSVIRRECLQEVGYFDENLRAAEDWDLWLRISRKYGIGCVNTPIACIRRHASNMSSDATRMDVALQRVLEKLYSSVDLPKQVRDLAPRARANAKVRCAVIAARRGKHGQALHFALQAILKDPTLVDAYYVIIKTAARQSV